MTVGKRFTFENGAKPLTIDQKRRILGERADQDVAIPVEKPLEYMSSSIVIDLKDGTYVEI